MVSVAHSIKALNAKPWPPMLQRLVWVTGGLALAVLPHAPHIKLWILLLAAAAAALRIATEVKHWALLPKWLRSLLAFFALLAVLLEYRTLNGIDAGTALLVVMAGMKLLETRTVRDLTVIVFLAYFSLFAAFLYNQDLLQLPYMLVTAWLLTVTLMRIHQTTTAMPVREAVWTTGKMFLQSLPLAIMLFVLFPRLPGQFWAVAPGRSAATSGLSDEMNPGDVSELSLSSALAFRARFDGALPRTRDRYWRGPVLHIFDGRTWRQSRTPFARQEVTSSGPTYSYDLMLEPHQRRWIFALDMPTRWPGRLVRTSDLQLLSSREQPISTLTSFRLQSATAYAVNEPLPAYMRRVDLSLPEGRNGRSMALARAMRERAGSDEAFIGAVLAKFRDEQYFYTLEPPRLQLDSVDDFLFNTRRGFCEHFASAFTMLARAAGIPARVVTGYQGGEYNPMSGYLVIRQSDAHAWSEVWLEGRGWVRVDPTAAVAPSRIERGIAAALGEDEALPGGYLRRNALLNQVQLAWDAANTFWNSQVVAFGEAQQHWLFDRFNLGFDDAQQLGIALALALVAFFAAMSLYLGWRFRPRARDPLAQIYDQLCRKLAKHGLQRAPHDGPNDYVARVLQARPELTSQLVEARNLYVALRYGPRSWGAQLGRSELSRLKFLVNQLKV
jgi:transglutaminase-like putative cysteine protease